MAKPIISNTILAIVAGGVLFFIGQSVYDVFTRAPVKGIEGIQSQVNNSQPGQTVSGTIQLPAQTIAEQTENANTLPAGSGNVPASQISQNHELPAAATATPETVVADPEPATKAEPATESAFIAEEEESVPHALKANPDLRQVIPPVPLAPPNPFPAPVAPTSDKQLFEATDNLNNTARSGEDSINNNFPAPQSSFPAPGANPAITPEPAPFETGEGSPFGNFPAPISNHNTNSGGINVPDAELERLRNLRQQKEQLRNDIGF